MSMRQRWHKVVDVHHDNAHDEQNFVPKAFASSLFSACHLPLYRDGKGHKATEITFKLLKKTLCKHALIWFLGIFSAVSLGEVVLQILRAEASGIDSCVEQVVGEIRLLSGDYICSPDGKFRFGLDRDGDLILLKGTQRIWTAGTSGQGVTTAKLQVDGNLVLLIGDQVVWASRTAGENAGIASLLLGDDGVVTITCSIRGHLWSNIVSSQGRVDSTSLYGKVMAGYQGWFFAEGDGGFDRWYHWNQESRGPVPNKTIITVDMWPDLRELDQDELYPTGFNNADGTTAGLYSAYNQKTVERHCRWMNDYGIDGVFVQRFLVSAVIMTPIVDKVLSNVRSGAEKYGRTFVTMYDIGGKDVGGKKFKKIGIVRGIINDWKHLVDNQNITSSKQYLHHNGRPLLAIWGFGFPDRHGDLFRVERIIRWFKYDAEDRYKVSLMGGIPTGWRDLSRDSRAYPRWARIYRMFDVISPWAVGRINNAASADRHRQKYTEPDLAECNSLGIDYLPVVFPGFSWKNLYPSKPFNEIPRNGGTFYWRQLYNAIDAGSRMVYVAMFDEVDEGTAIFKVAENEEQTPADTKGSFVTLDVDAGYPNIPSDWYLQLTGKASTFLREGQPFPQTMPELPKSVA